MYKFLNKQEDYKKEGNILSKTTDEFNKQFKSSFPINGHDIYYTIEDNSFWFKHRTRCIHEIITKYIPENSEIIDIGGGNGYTTRYLQDKGYNSILLEPSVNGCKNAELRGVKNIIMGTINNEDYLDNSIENVCMLDVLEYIKNDTEFLKILYSKLKKSGNFIVALPAFKILWSTEDENIGNLRRYEMNTILKLLKDAGFTIKYNNYLFSFLFIPILILRSLKDRLLKPVFNDYSEKKAMINNQHNTHNNVIIDKIISFLCKNEYERIKKNKKVYFGSSIVIVASK
jgi:SAM-dependent methyltransferase